MKANLLRAAKALAEDNTSSDSGITEVLVFPAENELRVVEIYDKAFKSGDELEPFYFAPDPESGIPFRLALALIQPSEKGKLRLPDGWGEWSDAEVIWSEGEFVNAEC